jgi:hypothetical protein
MRFKRLFKGSAGSDPFTVFAETYHIRIPRDTPPKAEPDEPDEPDEPIALRLMRTLAVFAETYRIRIPRDTPPKAEPDEPETNPLRLMRAHMMLGVPVGASRQEIAQAYKKLALKHHPDRKAGMGPKAREHSEERMKEINAAYTELSRREASL